MKCPNCKSPETKLLQTIADFECKKCHINFRDELIRTTPRQREEVDGGK